MLEPHRPHLLLPSLTSISMSPSPFFLPKSYAHLVDVTSFNELSQISFQSQKALQFHPHPEIFIIKSCMTNKLSCWMIWISAVTDPIRFSFQPALDEWTQEMEKSKVCSKQMERKKCFGFLFAQCPAQCFLCSFVECFFSVAIQRTFSDIVKCTISNETLWMEQEISINIDISSMFACSLVCWYFFVAMYASGKHLITAARKPRELCDNFQMHLRIDKVAAVHLPSVDSYWFSALARHLA